MHAQAAEDVLAWLGVPPPAGPVSATWLDTLVAACAQRVPWESASRIVRRASHTEDGDCVVSPETFWEQARTQGLGGTCFESNAALAALLQALGLEPTFTFNDMPPCTACHTALIVPAAGVRLMLDIGFPVHAALPLPAAGAVSHVATRWGTFTARAMPPDRFAIEQWPHPKPQAFELVDRPICAAAYAAATSADYGIAGLFLDRVIVKKVVAGDVWRFASGERPWVLERFHAGTRMTLALPSTTNEAASRLSAHFGMDHRTLRRALDLCAEQAAPCRRSRAVHGETP